MIEIRVEPGMDSILALLTVDACRLSRDSATKTPERNAPLQHTEDSVPESTARCHVCGQPAQAVAMDRLRGYNMCIEGCVFGV